MTRSKWAWMAVTLLLLVHAALLAHSATQHSPTMLEPALLASGLHHWESGRFELYRVNPPLVRMVAALPVIAAGYRSDWGGFYEAPGARREFAVGSDFVAANGDRTLWLMTIARWACIPFSLAGGLFAYLYARELWRSDVSGLIAVILWCFEPNMLAHAELVTNDVPCAALGLGATWLFWRWLRRPTWGRATIAGLVLGLTELSKTSWIFLFGLWPLLWLIDSTTARYLARSAPPAGAAPARASDLQSAPLLRRPQTQLCGMLLIALYLINLGYAFDGSFTRLKSFDFVSTSLTDLDTPGKVGNRFRGLWIGNVPVPLPRQYVLGLDLQKRDFEDWRRPNYLRGEWRTGGGWWYYYLYGLLVKTPHGVQILVGLAIFLPILDSRSRWRWSATIWPERRVNRLDAAPRMFRGSIRCFPDVLILLAPGLTLFCLVSSQTRLNEHFRYVLPTVAAFLVYTGRLGSLFESPEAHRLSGEQPGEGPSPGIP